jgi:6-phosphogluconolactonase
MNNNKKIKAYIGTYTKGESKGIYSFQLDIEHGKIEYLTLAAEAGNPTYLSVDNKNKYIYSVYQKGDDGGVAAFSRDEDTEELNLINCIVSEGSPPCHVNIDNKNKYLFSANYHRGTVDVYPLGETGELKELLSSAAHEGSGLNEKRQEKPHVHYVTLTPDERFLCAVDLGTDELVVYSFDNGKIARSKELSLSLKEGCGPRHMVFHPEGKFAYLLTELSAEIVVLEYSSSKPGFTIIQYIQTLPEDYSGENLGSAIHVSPDGSYVYAANRGHDAIAAFKIDPLSGRLEFVSHTSTGGMHPRDFAIDPTGGFIVVANMNSNNIVPFIIDKATGKLTLGGDAVSVPNPVCIKFLTAT